MRYDDRERIKNNLLWLYRQGRLSPSQVRRLLAHYDQLLRRKVAQSPGQSTSVQA
ncbi:MAG: hypothetical protein AAFQ61_09290 [Cyanobacteria bacterium J06626_23]